MGEHWLTYVLIIIGYFVLLTWFGHMGYKKSKSLTDFVAGGWGIGLWVSVGMFAATWVSAASVIGFPSMTYKVGLCSVTSIYAGYFFANSLMPLLASKLRMPDLPARTIPEYLRFRYEPHAQRSGLQALGAISMLLGYTAYVMIQIKAVGTIIGTVTGMPYTVACFLFLIFLIYTAAGGMWSVGISDLFNTVVIVITLFIAAIVLLDKVGGWDQMWVSFSSVNTPPVEGAKPTPPGLLTSMLGPYSLSFVIGLFIASSFGGAAAPHWLGRMQMPKNRKIAVLTPLYSQIIIFVVFLALLIIGVAGRGLMPTIPGGHDTDWLLPLLFVEHMPIFIGGLALAGVMAAAMSTANGMLLHQALALNYDVIRNLRKDKIDDDVLIKWNRIMIIVLGVVATLLALKPPKLIAIISALVFGFWGATYILPTFLGLYWKKLNKQGVYWITIAGPITYVVTNKLIKAKMMPGLIPDMVWALGVGLIGAIVLSHIFPPSPTAGWEPYWKEKVSDETHEALLAAMRETSHPAKVK
jgi:sodium/pantothenate symporter